MYVCMYTLCIYIICKLAAGWRAAAAAAAVAMVAAAQGSAELRTAERLYRRAVQANPRHSTAVESLRRLVQHRQRGLKNG